jgi:hypothetical protein
VIEILPERRRHAVRDNDAIIQAQFPAAARTTFPRTRFVVADAGKMVW